MWFSHLPKMTLTSIMGITITMLAKPVTAEIGFTPWCNSGWTTLNNTWIAAECGDDPANRKWTSINLDDCFRCWHGMIIGSVNHGNIKDCTKDCQRTFAHHGWEHAPWMCKVKQEDEGDDVWAWDLLDLETQMWYVHNENRLCCGSWGLSYCGEGGLPDGVTDPGPPQIGEAPEPGSTSS